MSMENPNSLLVSPTAKRHDIEREDGTLSVWVREPSFLEMQTAAQHLMQHGQLNLSDYWLHAFTHWVERTEPEIPVGEIWRLKPEIGKAISELLPAPQEMVEMLGFSTAQSASSTTI